MLARSKIVSVTALIAMIILSLGCTGETAPEIIIDIPDLGEYEPPVPEKTLVITVIAERNQKLGFTVYAGTKLNPESRIDAQTQNQLIDLIAKHIDDATVSNPALDAVLIECDGNVRSGDVEIVKSAIYQSNGQSSRKLFVGIRDDDKILD